MLDKIESAGKPLLDFVEKYYLWVVLGLCGFTAYFLIVVMFM